MSSSPKIPVAVGVLKTVCTSSRSIKDYINEDITKKRGTRGRGTRGRGTRGRGTRGKRKNTRKR